MPPADPFVEAQREIILALRDVRVSYPRVPRPIEALRGVSLHVRRGEKVALVGESGAGKSTIARLILGLLQDHASSISGSAFFQGRDIIADAGFVHRVRGDRVALIFQDPFSALNPAFTIGALFRDVLRRRNPELSRSETHRRATAALADVHLHEPERILRSYVFQLSGGMSQRVMIALALANDPELLVADEPGSNLDAALQARTLQLMEDLTRRRGASVLFISHNLGAVREFADRVYVIFQGRIVEHAAVAQLFSNPRHAYTQALLAAVPRLDRPTAPVASEFSPSFGDPLIVHPGCGEPLAANE